MAVPTYRMHLTAGAPRAGDSCSGGRDHQGSGMEVLVADVKFIEKPFASDDAAKAWCWPEPRRGLKVLLLSVTYR